MEYLQAEINVAWTERGSTGTLYEKEAIFLIDGTEDSTNEQLIDDAEDCAQNSVVFSHTFVEVLESSLLDRWLTDDVELYRQATKSHFPHRSRS